MMILKSESPSRPGVWRQLAKVVSGAVIFGVALTVLARESFATIDANDAVGITSLSATTQFAPDFVVPPQTRQNNDRYFDKYILAHRGI